MTDSTLLPLCPACRKGRLHAITRTEVFRPNGNDSTIRGDERLTGEEILPGFSVSLDELFGGVESAK